MCDITFRYIGAKRNVKIANVMSPARGGYP